jgi:thiamine biosynthesis lipoprotein
MIHIEFQAMGCKMAAFLDNDSRDAARALEQVPAWFEEWEQALSRFRPESELSQLNTSAGSATRVGPVLWEAVQAALEVAQWTGGLVSPAILNSLVLAGYNRSFDLIQIGSGPQLIPHTGHTASNPPGLEVWREILLDPGLHTITLPQGVGLDLGGTGKGWAAHQAMQRLRKYGSVLVDASGDLSVSDVQADGSPWPVAVSDPLQVHENLDMLALGGCGVATSGLDYRRWWKDGVWKHHIIDPRTGQPAETDLMSVTVIAPDTLQAEAAAKTVIILGSEAGLSWLENQPELSGLLALQDGRLIYSQGMYSHLWSTYDSEN